jgi:acyl-CoA thioesterase FadM
MPPLSSRFLALQRSSSSASYLLRIFGSPSPAIHGCLFSTSIARGEDTKPSAGAAKATASENPKENAKWLGDTKARIGKCIVFGMNTQQIKEAAGVLKILSEHWRDFVAGRQGFLTSKQTAGLFRHKVAWGEMDSMVRFPLLAFVLAYHKYIYLKKLAIENTVTKIKLTKQAHVNNVTYNRYAESGRIQWAYNYALHIDPSNFSKWSQLWTPHGIGLILRSIKTEFKFPMTWPDRVSVFHKLRYLPQATDENFVLDVVILSEGKQRIAATCEEDNVVYDYRVGRKGNIDGWMLEAFERTWKEQEMKKVIVKNMMGEIENIVERLEKETWDREDAVEDMGKP